MRPLLPALAAAGLALVAGCDFTPTLDIETPTYEPGLVVRSMLVADSAAVVWVDESWDPYEGRPRDRGGRPETPAGLFAAEVVLLRGGAEVERLTARRDRCVDLSQPTPEPGAEIQRFPCGPFVGTARIEAGATYTLRVTAAGLPAAEATVTVPLRPAVEVTDVTTASDPRGRFQIRLADGPGPGDRYGLTLYNGSNSQTVRGTVCENGVCRDTVYTVPTRGRFPVSFDTSDPVLLASSREVAGSGVSFASFTDETFNGRLRTFTIAPSGRYDFGPGDGQVFVVQVAALSGDVYDVYQIEQFDGGEDNPFAEPINRPSNVRGGYGLVGGLALSETAVRPRTP